MPDDLALLAILTKEALVRLGPANGIEGGNLNHADLFAALREVLDEAGSEVHLEPKDSRMRLDPMRGYPGRARVLDLPDGPPPPATPMP